MNLSRRKFFTLAGTGTAGARLRSPLQAFYTKRTLAASPSAPSAP
ncbi:hypothetical protein [Dendronalium sp. ChiSLP03b]|nr:hypothetical protein [Dendronalium sp. ChiSLP03b]